MDMRHMPKTLKIFSALTLGAMLSCGLLQASEEVDRWNQARQEEIRAKQAKIDGLRAQVEALTKQIDEEKKTTAASQDKIWKEYKQGLETERKSLQDQLRAIENREQLFEAELDKRKQQDELRIQEKSDKMGSLISQVDFLGKQIAEDRKSYEEQYRALKEAETRNVKNAQGGPSISNSLAVEQKLENGSFNIASPQTAGLAGKLRNERTEYYIEIGDTLGIDVWRVPDLTRDVTVRPDGRISMPIVGDIDVVGLTLTQLRDILSKKFADYVWNPQVSISVRTFGGRKFIVLGEVKGPGVYRFQQDISLIEALALAGGFTPQAKRGKVMIIRGDIRREPQVRMINANMENLLKKGMLTENLDIKPNDIIYVTKDLLTDYKEVIQDLISPTLSTATDAFVLRSAIRTAQDKRN